MEELILSKHAERLLIVQPHLNDDKRARLLPITAIFILILTALLSLLWSQQRLMWNDEFLSFYTDSVPTFSDVLRVQLHYPISLDPPTYHLLSHGMMDIFGRNAMALRVPALAGFLLMQVSLFFFVRRMAGERPALIAMVVPMATASFRYSVEGRPYAWLLGLYASALLCWQVAAFEGDGRKARLIPLAGLTASIVLATTSHYFGLLIVVPIVAGELARTLRRHRVDGGIWAATLLGFGSVLLIVPFGRALAPYRLHYYVQAVSWHNVTQGYRELFLRYNTWPIKAQRAAASVLTVATVVLGAAGWKRFRARAASEAAELWVALVALSLLPLVGFLVGRFVTHTMEVRYVIAALIPFAAILGVVCENRLRSSCFYRSALVFILGGSVVLQVHNICIERHDTQTMRASFDLSATATAALKLDPQERIYIQSLNDFYLDTYYMPDAMLRSRFAYVYGQEQEVYWLKHDTNFVTAVHMQQFAPLTVTPYTALLHQDKPFLLLNHSGWEWIEKDLSARHLPEEPVAAALRGDLVRVANSTVP